LELDNPNVFREHTKMSMPCKAVGLIGGGIVIHE
jgi:hypothetical protein